MNEGGNTTEWQVTRLRTAISNPDVHYVWPWHVASQGSSFLMWRAAVSETLSTPYDLWAKALGLLLFSPPVASGWGSNYVMTFTLAEMFKDE